MKSIGHIIEDNFASKDDNSELGEYDSFEKYILQEFKSSSSSNEDDSDSSNDIQTSFNKNHWKPIDSLNSFEMVHWSNKFPIVRSEIISNKAKYLFDIHFTIEFWNLIVNETNQYAIQFFQNNQEYLLKFKSSRVNRWKPTTIIEMKLYLAILVYITLVNMFECSFRLLV